MLVVDEFTELTWGLITNGCALFLLSILVYFSWRITPPRVRANRPLYLLFLVSFVEVCVHLGTTAVQYRRFFGHVWLGTVLYSLVFVVNSIYLLVWVQYLSGRLAKFGSGQPGYRRWLMLVRLPSLLILALSLVNMVTPVFFSYADFYYVRLPAYYLTLVVPILYFAYGVLLYVRSQYRGRIYQIVPFGIMVVPIVLAHVLESLFINLCVIPLGNVIVLLILVLTNARQNSSMDALTGFYSRSELFDHLADGRSTSPAGRTLFGLMFDLDRFKAINDTYGHLAGDEAIVTFSNVLRQVLPQDALAFRYGGDEFVVLAPLADEAAARQLAERFARALERANESSPASWTLSASCGITPWEQGDTASAFLARMDAGMYEQKERLRRRSTDR